MTKVVLVVELVEEEIEGRDASTGCGLARRLPPVPPPPLFLADSAVPGLVGKTQGPAPRH